MLRMTEGLPCLRVKFETRALRLSHPDGRASVVWINEAVRLAAALAAIATFYVAWFVYEDEERRLQNKIETWWLQFDDIRSKMVSRQTAFVIIVAQRASDILDRMFGQALFGKDSIATAVCLAIGGLYLFPQVFFALFPVGATWGYIAAGFSILACAAAPLVSPHLRRLPRIIMWMFVAYLVATAMLMILEFVLSVLSGTAVKASSLLDFSPSQLLGIAALLVGIALTLFEVAVARHAMRWTILARSEWPIVLGMALVSVPIGIVLVLWVKTLFLKLSAGTTSVDLVAITPQNLLFWWTVFLVVACFVSTALCGLLAIIASIMLLHRIIWPLTSRVLYALGRYRLVQNKVALHAAGVTLAGIAITGVYGWQTILKHFGIT